MQYTEKLIDEVVSDLTQFRDEYLSKKETDEYIKFIVEALEYIKDNNIDIGPFLTEFRDEVLSKKETDKYIKFIVEILKNARNEVLNEVKKELRDEIEQEVRTEITREKRSRENPSNEKEPDEIKNPRKKKKRKRRWTKEKFQSTVIGMSYDYAQEFVKKNCPKFSLRPFWIDGDLQVLTMDKQKYRLNVPVKGGVIVEKTTHDNHGRRYADRGAYWG